MPLANTETLQPLLPLLARTLGHRPSPATVWRWCNGGLKVGDQRVKLRAVRVGCKLYSTPDDVAEFIRRQNEPAESPDDDLDERDAATTRRLVAAGLLGGGA